MTTATLTIDQRIAAVRAKADQIAEAKRASARLEKAAAEAREILRDWLYDALQAVCGIDTPNGCTQAVRACDQVEFGLCGVAPTRCRPRLYFIASGSTGEVWIVGRDAECTCWAVEDALADAVAWLEAMFAEKEYDELPPF